jgi:hypothetical protein
MTRVALISLASLALMIPNSAPSWGSTKEFKNCTELNQVYPGGVAIPGAINKGGKTKLKPKFSDALYRSNIKSDRDKDGIACEK